MPAMMRDEDIGLAFDMHGCPNRCRHCWLDHQVVATPRRCMTEDDVRWVVGQFRAFRRPAEDRAPWRGSIMRRHPEAGQTGWLVTDPSHAGKGLGTIVAACATNRLAAEGYRRPCLGTEDFRVAAISIYLKLGWVSYVYREDPVPRWRAIFARLGREFDGAEECRE